MSLVIQREVDLSDHTVMFVVTGRTGRTFEVHCDRCGEFVVFETEVDARRFGGFCQHCEGCQDCEGTGTVSSGDLNDDFDWRTDCDADITCPTCNGTGRET